MAKLPRGVRWTPALVPADASASVKTRYLTKDCREDTEVCQRTREKDEEVNIGERFKQHATFICTDLCILVHMDVVIRNRGSTPNRKRMC